MNPTPGMIGAADSIHEASLMNLDSRQLCEDFIVANVGPEIESRDKRIKELEQQLVGKQHDFDCLRREYVAVIEGTKKTKEHIDQLMSNSMELKNQHAAVTAERDGWKKTHDLVLSQAQKDNLRAEDADRYEEWLLDIGALCGCGHVDEQLPNCILHEYRKIEEECDAANERAEKIEKRYRELLDAFAKHLECGPLDDIDLHEAEETVANNYFLRMTQASELRDSLLKRAEQAEADAAAMREQNSKLMDGIANIADDFEPTNAGELGPAIDQMRMALKQLASEVCK